MDAVSSLCGHHNVFCKHLLGRRAFLYSGFCYPFYFALHVKLQGLELESNYGFYRGALYLIALVVL